MNKLDLQAYVEEISMLYFNKPFKHEAYFNHRLRTTGGRYHLETHNLDFNPKILELFGLEIFKGIVKHELCHYHLHREKKGYRHRDSDFRQLLKRVGGLRYTPSIETKTDFVMRWVYECKGCGAEIYRKRRFNVEKYICIHCKDHFELQGKKELKLDSP